MPAKTFECSNPDCSNRVSARRPSTTGDHWCSAKECMALKQRLLRAARKLETVNRSTLEDERMDLVRVALHRPRVPCPSCGLANAVPGFLHRSAPGSTVPCSGVGGSGRAAGPHWLDLIHPELVIHD